MLDCGIMSRTWIEYCRASTVMQPGKLPSEKCPRLTDRQMLYSALPCLPSLCEVRRTQHQSHWWVLMQHAQSPEGCLTLSESLSHYKKSRRKRGHTRSHRKNLWPRDYLDSLLLLPSSRDPLLRLGNAFVMLVRVAVVPSFLQVASATVTRLLIGLPTGSLRPALARNMKARRLLRRHATFRQKLAWLSIKNVHVWNVHDVLFLCCSGCHCCICDTI